MYLTIHNKIRVTIRKIRLLDSQFKSQFDNRDLK